jgi:hypothetical protein
MVDVRLPDGRVARFPDTMPREEIRSFIQQKFPEPSAPSQAASSVPQSDLPQREGLFPQLASGVTEGASSLLSLPNTIEVGLRSIGPAIGNAMGGDFAYPEGSLLPDVGQSFKNFATNTNALSAPSEDAAGRLTRRVGQEIGANLIPGAGPLTRAKTVGQALRIGGTEAALTTGSGLGAGIAQEIAPENAGAEMLGQLAGFATTGGLLAGGRRLVTPNPISDERLSVARALQGEGIDLTAGQTTGSNKLRYTESELGGPVAEEFMEKQAGQFTRAALKRAGISADRATPDVIDDAFRTVGAEFDRLSANTLIPLDTNLGQDIGQAWRSYTDIVPESARAPVAKNFLSDLADLARGHGSLPGPGSVQTPYLSGEAYKAYRSRLNRYLRSSKDPELKMFLEDITKAMDDSAERYLASSNPDELGAWREARKNYRNLLTIEKAATGAGENLAQGYITPQRLRQAVVGSDSRGYARGYNDFSELVHGANAMMTPLPNSGTAGRLSARNLVSVPSTIGGALIGGASGDAMLGIAGGAAGAMIPGQIGRGLMSAPGRAYLSNQALTPLGVGDSYAASEIARILAAQGSYDQ